MMVGAAPEGAAPEDATPAGRAGVRTHESMKMVEPAMAPEMAPGFDESRMQRPATISMAFSAVDVRSTGGEIGASFDTGAMNALLTELQSTANNSGGDRGDRVIFLPDFVICDMTLTTLLGLC